MASSQWRFVDPPLNLAIHCKVRRASELCLMPWKNGGGTTTQYAIEPKAAQFPDDPFFYRISSAVVNQDGAFSQFAGYDRLLAVWNGQGLRLNDHILPPGKVLSFHGETPMDAQLLGGSVTDIGVIYDRQAIHAEFFVYGPHFERRPAGRRTSFDPSLFSRSGDHFLICASGEINIMGSVLCIGDFLFVRSSVMDKTPPLPRELKAPADLWDRESRNLQAASFFYFYLRRRD